MSAAPRYSIAFPRHRGEPLPRVAPKPGAHGITLGVTTGLCLITSLAGLGCAAGAMTPRQHQSTLAISAAPSYAAFTALNASDAEDKTTALLLSMTARCPA